MSRPSVDLELSTLRARDARARLFRTFDELKVRLTPSHIFDEAMDTVRSSGGALAMTTAGVARKRPRIAASAAAAGALLALWRLTRRRAGRKR